MLDLAVTGGTLVDGLGGPPRITDVGVRAGRIVAVGHLDEPAATRLDATGLVVAPGFVDLHSHSDLTLLSDGRARSKVAQGVTTEVIGNCGMSPFPCPPPSSAAIREAVAFLEPDPDIAWVWTDLEGYRSALAAARPAVHVAALVGHIPLRFAGGGLEDALAAGAAGCSTGLMYAPVMSAGRDELLALGRVVARHDRLFAVHMRDYGDALLPAVDEAIDVARTTGCRLQISHLAVAGRRNWGMVARALERIDAALADGCDVGVDIYPYLAGSAPLSQLLPRWARAGGTPAIVGQVTRPAERGRILREWEDILLFGWDEVEVAHIDPGMEDLLGLTLAEVGSRQDRDPAEAALDLIRDTENRVLIVAYGRSEADLLAVLGHPAAAIGSDGLAMDPDGPSGAGRPHPRSYGCYPRLLGRYVRDGTLPLERAIAMSTSLPADRVGLSDRGRLTVGAAADLVVFDAATVEDRATFAEPGRFPLGIEAVVVDGRPVVVGGEQRDDVRPGRFLSAVG